MIVIDAEELSFLRSPCSTCGCGKLLEADFRWDSLEFILVTYCRSNMLYYSVLSLRCINAIHYAKAVSNFYRNDLEIEWALCAHDSAVECHRRVDSATCRYPVGFPISDARYLGRGRPAQACASKPSSTKFIPLSKLPPSFSFPPLIWSGHALPNSSWIWRSVCGIVAAYCGSYM